MFSLLTDSSQLKPTPDLSRWIVKLSDHYCDGGGYGDVWKCLYNRDSVSKEVAVKALRFQFMQATEESNGEDKYVRLARRELGIWRRLDHKNIVPFLGIAYGFGPHVALVSLWMPHGTLRAFLAAHDNKLTVYHKLQLLLDIADGLLYLHSQPFVHGDLSSNNVLVDETYCARLADFGLASVVGETPQGMTYLHASTMRAGTVRWAAPEHFSQDADKMFQRTTKADIYSFGHIVFQVLSGKEPWSEVREDFRVVLCLSQGHRPTRPLSPPIDNRHWDLIESCWRPANERPKANDVVLMLQSFLASCSTKVPLHDFLRSPQITLQYIIPPDQESSAQHGMDNPSASEDHPKDLQTFSGSHLTESLMGDRIAQLEMISKRREPLLREMYRMMQRRDNAGHVLTMHEIEDGDADEDDGMKQFMARFDLFKNPQSSIMSLFTHSLPSPSEPITKKTEGPADLNVDHPMSEPFASGTHIHVVEQEDQEDVVMNDIAETPEAVESSRRPQTPWAADKPTFVLPAPPSPTTPFILSDDLEAITVDGTSHDPSFTIPSVSVSVITSQDARGFSLPRADFVGNPISLQGTQSHPPPWLPSPDVPSVWTGHKQEAWYDANRRPTYGPANSPEQRWWFAEGPDYGPVLEPFLIKVVGAPVTVNSFLTPPSVVHQDYLRWNMLFPTVNCYRTSESLRSWMKGRNEPAVHPRVTHIQLISRSFPWMIHVRAQNSKLGVTCEEILNSIARHMHDNAVKKDHENMSESRKREVLANYTFNRSSDGTVPGRRLGEALKRIDWLGSATRFGGLVMDDGFVKERCGDVLPCTFELKCLLVYPLTAGERGEILPYLA